MSVVFTGQLLSTFLPKYFRLSFKESERREEIKNKKREKEKIQRMIY